jgi:hypothetical protein
VGPESTSGDDSTVLVAFFFVTLDGSGGGSISPGVGETLRRNGLVTPICPMACRNACLFCVIVSQASLMLEAIEKSGLVCAFPWP